MKTFILPSFASILPSFPRKRESRAGSKQTYRLVVLVLGAFLIGSPSFAEAFDHSAWDKILNETVHTGVVDYGQIQDRYPDLQGYLKSLETADLKLYSKEEQLAFCINAYNAHCVNGVLAHGAIGSVNEVPEFFKNTRFVLAGEEQSLDSLEQKILRKMEEPRIHFALVRAAKGSPKLSSKAYTGATLDQDLVRQASDFFLDPTKNRLDREKGVLSMSRILKWYQEDFTLTSNSVLAFIRPYLSAEDGAYIDENPGKVKVEYLDFDWSLNGTY